MKKIINNEIIMYIIVGILTTIVSYLACFFSKFVLDSNVAWENFFINTIGWISGVCFSYPLNRKLVFKSENKNIVKEFGEFAFSRISTWIIDVSVMWLMVNIFSLNFIIVFAAQKLSLNLEGKTITNLNYWIAKIFISSVLVTLFNYIISKFFIFKKK